MIRPTSELASRIDRRLPKDRNVPAAARWAPDDARGMLAADVGTIWFSHLRTVRVAAGPDVGEGRVIDVLLAKPGWRVRGVAVRRTNAVTLHPIDELRGAGADVVAADGRTVWRPFGMRSLATELLTRRVQDRRTGRTGYVVDVLVAPRTSTIVAVRICTGALAWWTALVAILARHPARGTVVPWQDAHVI